jgi:uncharacterized protein (TIGR02145 family)
MSKYVLFFIMIAGFALLGCKSDTSNELSPITLGNQIWSDKNLDVSTNESWCMEDCRLSGRFYTWEAAMHLADSIQGWRMPNDKDWRKLEYFLGSASNEDTFPNRTGGDKLKKYPGFNIFPGCFELGQHRWNDERVVFWTSDTIHYQGNVLAKCRMLSNGGPKNDQIYNFYNLVSDSMGLNVRLIKE